MFMTHALKTKQKTALVTGGSRGIGRAIVLRLADDGFRVIVNYNKSKKEVLELAKTLKLKNQDFLVIRADISKEKEVKKMLETVKKEVGFLDVLVNNAGIIATQPFCDLKLNSFDKIIQTNLRGNILVAKYALPFLKKSTGSKIIFILSSSAFVGSSSQFAYVVSKAGLIGAVRALALELASSNILVNGVVPGYINTQMASLVKKQMKAGLKKIPLSRIGEPQEVADLVAFLASSKNSYITGQCIHINGARFMA